ncbi:MAG: hypothetical protein L6R42_003474 [Xanthoria sp. 1 TBL-2021]|nr:MAG: hypothetical protein L6R42_003474 [Xanthoria sp. 1 TBL-2021]
MTSAYNPTKTPLTARETQPVVIAMQCLDGNVKTPLQTPLQINYKQVSTMAGYTSEKSAYNTVNPLIKHKITASTIDNFFVAYSAGNGTKRADAKIKASTSKSDGQGQDEDTMGAGDGDGAGEAMKGKGNSKKRARTGGGSGNSKRAKEVSIKVEEDEVNGLEAVGSAKFMNEKGEEGSLEAAIEGRGDGVEV